MTQSVPPPHREGVASLQPRDYDGKFVVTHTVQHGQTLTKIAAIYLFPRWEPIWIYNTKVERVLDDNPDVIRTGVTIFIPRSRDGYDALIKTRQLARSPTSCSNYLEPSVVADGYLFLTRGETTDQTYEGTRKRIEQAVAATSSMIDQRIEKYEEECALLYG